MQSIRPLTAVFTAIMMLSLSSLFADQGTMQPMPRVQPQMRAEVAPRPAYTPAPYAAVFGGVNFSQWGDGDGSGFGRSTGRGTIRSMIGYAGGIKAGVEFPGVFEVAEAASYRDLLYPAVEMELFYHGLRFKSTVATADLDSFVFMVNPLLKAKVGRYKLYLGPGIGGSFISADNIRSSRFGGYGAKDDLVLAVQGIAGAEFAVTDHIGLFTEYKYLHLFDTDLSDNAVHARFDHFGNHLINAGLKYSF
jgi:opacity protein-like surface antigen